VKTGTRLNHYEIVAPLGEGGMGQVYRAEDTRLKRQVALKVLPPEVASDPDRLARLEREAQVLAQLDHPNVAGVYGLEEATVEGRAERFLVMQLAEGETLADRLGSGALPVDEAVGIARQVALGLEAAHARGIVHRDLKPANVMLGSTGEVKILDFGLAKAVVAGEEASRFSADLTASPTVVAATAAGVIMGTAPYMSPEQARGRPVDRRTDLWALGCVLYEMLTGKRAFEGETATDVIASVVQREPDWDALPATTPGALRRVLAQCLAKDAADRLRDGGDAALLLVESLDADRAVDAARAPVGQGVLLPWIVAAASVLVALGALWLRPTSEASVAPTRFSLVIPDDLGVPTLQYQEAQSLATLALSPDADRIAYVAHDGSDARLMVQRLGEFEATTLPGTLGVIAPFFGPRGRSLAFFSGAALWRIDLPGGVPLEVAAASPFAEGGTWTDDDRIVFTASYADALSIVSASGGEARELTRLNSAANEVSHRWPHALPGDRGVLFVATSSLMESLDEARIAVVGLDGGEHRILIDGGTRPAYLSSGHIVFARNGALYAVPFDLDRLEVTGAPTLVLEGVTTAPTTGNAFYAATREGALAYIAGGSTAVEAQVVRLAPGQRAQPTSLPLSNFNPSSVSPDGRRLLGGRAAANDKLWIADLVVGTLTRLTSGIGNDQPGPWSPNGRWAIFSSDRAGGLRQMYRMPVDGSAAPELMVERARSSYPGRVAREPGLLGYEMLTESNGFDAFVLAIDPDGAPSGEPILVAGGPGYQGEVAPSPDGNLVAYTSSESGESAIYVMARSTGNRARVTRSSGRGAAWLDEGRRLAYLDDRTLMVVDVLDTEALTFGDPEVLGENTSSFGYAVDVDGRSLFVGVAADMLESRPEIRIDLDWGRRVAEATSGANRSR
jgi:Tol biopolymer transport system component